MTSRITSIISGSFSPSRTIVSVTFVPFFPFIIFIYNNTFTNFFGLPEVMLPQIPGNNAQTTFDFIATFEPTSGNDYKNSSMKFNLQVGFENGVSFTDTTVSIGGQQGGGGGGGGGNGMIFGLKNYLLKKMENQ